MLVDYLFSILITLSALGRLVEYNVVVETAMSYRGSKNGDGIIASTAAMSQRITRIKNQTHTGAA